MRLVPPHPSPGVFAVDATSAQIVWTGASTATVTGPDGAPHHLDGPGIVAVGGLAPGRPNELTVTTPDGERQLRATTLTSPPGEERCRIATMNDLHLGSRHFGALRGIRDPGAGDAALQCALAGMREAVEWGAEVLFLKGDLVHKGTEREWADLATLVEACPVPVHVTLGNHEVAHARDATTRAVLSDLGLSTERVEIVDVPALRVAIVDVTEPGRHDGTLRHVHDELVAAVSGTTPALVLHHHQMHTAPFPVVYPRGIYGSEVRRLLDDVRAANPNVMFASGHSHRHRRHVRRGVTMAELGSSKDHPGTWCGYTVYDGGITQTVRRIADPDALEWLERTAHTLLGWWPWWSAGRRTDRCFTLTWA